MSDKYKRVRTPIDKVLGVGGYYREPMRVGREKKREVDRGAAAEMWGKLGEQYKKWRYDGDFEKYVQRGGY